jgi:hypothetical protein
VITCSTASLSEGIGLIECQSCMLLSRRHIAEHVVYLDILLDDNDIKSEKSLKFLLIKSRLFAL